MISPRHPINNRLPPKVPLKLPQIQLKRQIESVKKYSAQIPDLPSIKNEKLRNQLLVDKENNSQNVLKRKNSIKKQVKARLLQIQAADKLVKDVLGGPEVSFQMGGDMTNFEHKIQINRQLIRKLKSHQQLKKQDEDQVDVKNQKNKKQTKSKSVSSKQLNKVPAIPQMKLKVQQNRQIQQLQKDNNQKIGQMIEQNQLRFKSERKAKSNKIQAQQEQQENKVFKSIKQILSDPQKVALKSQTKKYMQVKPTIEELQYRLKKMNNQQMSQSKLQNKNLDESQSYEPQLNVAKSVGMIPISNSAVFEEHTFKNWNKVQFQQPSNSQQGGYFVQKKIKYHKSNFQNQLDHIQKLQMKNYKSIQTMVENRKLLVDLRLLSEKNKNCLIKDKIKENKLTQIRE